MREPLARRHLDPRFLLLGTALSLALVLLPIRAHLVGYPWRVIFGPWRELLKVAFCACYDLLLVAGLTTAFWGALELARGRPRLQRGICGIYLIVAAGVLAVSVANVRVVATIGTPFNYQWLRYSEFLMSLEAREAIRASVSPQILIAAGLLVAAMVALAVPITIGLHVGIRRPLRFRALVIAGVAPLFLYFYTAHSFLTERRWPVSKLANPIIAFARSVSIRPVPRIFDLDTPFGSEEFEPAGKRPREIDVPSPMTRAGISNVFVFVLESTPAEYLETYGGEFPVTPELMRRRAAAIQFSHIYAPAPATNYSLFSLFCSLYPPISYASLTSSQPNIELPSIVGELRSKGYRTAFFSSGDVGFQRGDQFLRHRGFEWIQNYRERDCSRPRIINTREDYRALDGTHDLCTAQSVIDWLGKEPGRPFFGVMWTLMTHYPYYMQGQETDFGVGDPFFNRYLNALREGDRALGAILDRLDVLGIADETLVVVLGDHGQAFGRHDQITHAQKIYEENVHVPLLLINPRMFRGEENATLGGIVDIAPTILDVLGLSRPAGWQGRSLFGRRDHPRVYFFAPWSEFWFGYREGEKKYLFNASRDRFEVYDLADDPLETRNLAAEPGLDTTLILQRLAAWVQFQRQFFDSIEVSGPLS